MLELAMVTRVTRHQSEYKLLPRCGAFLFC
jgi:hypothetical protein